MQVQVYTPGYAFLSVIIYAVSFKASTSYQGEQLSDLQKPQVRLLIILT